MGRGKKNRPDEVWEGFYQPYLEKHNRRVETNPNATRESYIQRMYTRVLMEIASNRFKWNNLPSEIDPRFLELTLLSNGVAIFYDKPEDKKFPQKFMVMQGYPSGQWNFQQNPISFTVAGANLPQIIDKQNLTAAECVPIWSNYLRMPDLDIVQIYATKLANIDMTIEVNMRNARRSRVVFATENQRLSASNINRSIDQGDPVIMLDGEQYPDMQVPITNVDLGVDPDSIRELHVLRTRLWGECMGLLGIDFANTEKKERVQAAEVDANNSQVDAMRAVNLNARRDAADQINRKYGLKISVEYHITTETSAAIPAAMTGTGEIEL